MNNYSVSECEELYLAGFQFEDSLDRWVEEGQEHPRIVRKMSDGQWIVCHCGGFSRHETLFELIESFLVTV